MIKCLKKVKGFKDITPDSEVNALLKKCEMIIGVTTEFGIFIWGEKHKNSSKSM